MAVLFELAELRADRSTNTQLSITSQPCVWKKSPTKNKDNPLQTINELITALLGSSRITPPTTDSFDTWPEFEPDVDSFHTGMKTLNPNACMLQNRYLKQTSPPPTTSEECAVFREQKSE